MLESRVLWDLLRRSWLLDVCGVHWRFSMALYRQSEMKTWERRQLQDSVPRRSGAGLPGTRFCSGLIHPFLSVVRWGGWSVNPRETWPPLCNLVKTAGQHCHLSEGERMWICFARSYAHFKGTLASFLQGQGRSWSVSGWTWWCTWW